MQSNISQHISSFMAGPSGFGPHNDPFGSPLPHNILDFGNDLNPTLADLSKEGAFSYSSSMPQQYNTTHLEANHPHPDPMVQDNVHTFANQAGNFEAGPSERHGESHPGQEFLGSSQNYSEVIPLSIWPEPPIPFFCSCCQVLREIVHTNGINFMKLEIHGRLGLICHAIQQQNISVGSSGNDNFRMFDFSKRSTEEIKLFLIQYCLDQNSAGYCMVQDPLSAYYEALCIGLDWTEDANDDLGGPNANNAGGISDMEQEIEAEDNVPRTCVAAQRERAGKMKLSDFSNYFHLPIEEAAKQVNLCPTVVKKICRREGVARWPYRKVKSIVKQVSILRSTLDVDDAASRTRTLAEIDRLQHEMIQHCGGVVPAALYFE